MRGIRTEELGSRSPATVEAVLRELGEQDFERFSHSSVLAGLQKAWGLDRANTEYVLRSCAASEDARLHIEQMFILKMALTKCTEAQTTEERHAYERQWFGIPRSALAHQNAYQVLGQSDAAKVGILAKLVLDGADVDPKLFVRRDRPPPPYPIVHLKWYPEDGRDAEFGLRSATGRVEPSYMEPLSPMHNLRGQDFFWNLRHKSEQGTEEIEAEVPDDPPVERSLFQRVRETLLGF